MKNQHTEKLKSKLLPELFRIAVQVGDCPELRNIYGECLTRVGDIENQPAEGFTIDRLALIAVYISNQAYGPVRMPHYAKKLTEEYNELMKAIDGGNVQDIRDELGDVLLVITKMANFYEADLFGLLNTAVLKMFNRITDIDFSRQKRGHLSDAMDATIIGKTIDNADKSTGPGRAAGYEDYVKKLEDMIALHRESFAKSDQGVYVNGIANGLILAHATLINHEPDYIKGESAKTTTFRKLEFNDVPEGVHFFDAATVKKIALDFYAYNKNCFPSMLPPDKFDKFFQPHKFDNYVFITPVDDHEKDGRPATFEEELTVLINRHNMEEYSNTPDFILAEYVWRCLDNFSRTTVERLNWYGINHVPGEIHTFNRLEDKTTSQPTAGTGDVTVEGLTLSPLELAILETIDKAGQRGVILDGPEDMAGQKLQEKNLVVRFPGEGNTSLYRTLSHGLEFLTKLKFYRGVVDNLQALECFQGGEPKADCKCAACAQARGEDITGYGQTKSVNVGPVGGRGAGKTASMLLPAYFYTMELIANGVSFNVKEHDAYLQELSHRKIIAEQDNQFKRLQFTKPGWQHYHDLKKMYDAGAQRVDIFAQRKTGGEFFRPDNAMLKRGIEAGINYGKEHPDPAMEKVAKQMLENMKNTDTLVRRDGKGGYMLNGHEKELNNIDVELLRTIEKAGGVGLDLAIKQQINANYLASLGLVEIPVPNGGRYVINTAGVCVMGDIDRLNKKHKRKIEELYEAVEDIKDRGDIPLHPIGVLLNKALDKLKNGLYSDYNDAELLKVLRADIDRDRRAAQ